MVFTFTCSHTFMHSQVADVTRTIPNGEVTHFCSLASFYINTSCFIRDMLFGYSGEFRRISVAGRLNGWPALVSEKNLPGKCHVEF